MRSPLTFSPERSVKVALFCAWATPVTSMAAAQNALRTVRFNIVQALHGPTDEVTLLSNGSLCKGRAKAAAYTYSVRTSVLDNGLKILIQELHTAPLVSVWCWYRVGSG